MPEDGTGVVADLDVLAAEIASGRGLGAHLDLELFAHHHGRGDVPHRQAGHVRFGLDQNGKRLCLVKNAIALRWRERNAPDVFADLLGSFEGDVGGFVDSSVTGYELTRDHRAVGRCDFDRQAVQVTSLRTRDLDPQYDFRARRYLRRHGAAQLDRRGMRTNVLRHQTLFQRLDT